MRALDTNVVVRFLTGDDRRQATRARAAIERGEVFIATTVFLESEWVLRSAYGFLPGRIAEAFRGLAGLPGVSVDDPAPLALTNFQRSVSITPVVTGGVTAADLRLVTITIQYTTSQFHVPKSYILTAYISQYR